MFAAWIALLSSRKFWVGMIALAGTVGAVVLVATKTLETGPALMLVGSATGIGMSLIASIAWEDVGKAKGAGTSSAPVADAKVEVNVTAEPEVKP